MPEEKKLGPGVVYKNPDKTNKLVTVGGVLFKEGQSVNIVEKLGEQRAQADPREARQEPLLPGRRRPQARGRENTAADARRRG